MLTAAEKGQYKRDGYVIPAGFRLTEAEMTPLRAALDRVLAGNPDIMPDRMINPHLDGGRPYGVKGQAAFDTLARDPRILDMVEAVMGPDIILWLTHLFCKPASSTRAVPWHQDGQYWPIEPWATCTVWLALDKVDKDNGAMRVIPGSQTRTDYRHHADESPDLTLNQVISDEQLDEDAVRYIELERGQASLHDVGIVHGSAANGSGRRRAGLALRYMPATSVMRRGTDMPLSKFDWNTLPIELVRGVNRHDGNDFNIGHDSPKWRAA
jgi:hypothetical protein